MAERQFLAPHSTLPEAGGISALLDWFEQGASRRAVSAPTTHPRPLRTIVQDSALPIPATTHSGRQVSQALAR